MEDVQSPLPSSTPLLLVKPPVGLATPAVFKALDLDARSTADPKQLLAGGDLALCITLLSRNEAEWHLHALHRGLKQDKHPAAASLHACSLEDTGDP